MTARYKLITPDTGESQGSRVMDLQTGEQLHNVRSVTARVDVDSAVELDVSLIVAAAEVAGEIRLMIGDPVFGHGGPKPVRAVLFEDGTAFQMEDGNLMASEWKFAPPSHYLDKQRGVDGTVEVRITSLSDLAHSSVLLDRTRHDK